MRALGVILIVIACLILFPEVIGVIFGIVGAIFGIVVGIAGAIFGVVAGILGSIIGIVATLGAILLPFLVIGALVYGMFKLVSA